jgi:hypothetical protein
MTGSGWYLDKGSAIRYYFPGTRVLNLQFVTVNGREISDLILAGTHPLVSFSKK